VFYPYIREEVFIKLNLGTAQKAVIERDISLSERLVRVEEGIKHQGDLLEKMLDQIDMKMKISRKGAKFAKYAKKNNQFASSCLRFPFLSRALVLNRKLMI
jgi:hypothetical protein